MRADRLISLMMLLQTNGQMTAEALAEALEVSKRTIYRDIDVLSGAGVPVYANGGPGGGYALLDNYRTSLTGFNKNELRSLFFLTLPSPLSELDEANDLKSAVLKLTNSLHQTVATDIDHMRQRLHIDTANWFRSEEPLPYLTSLQAAIWDNTGIEILYRTPSGKQSKRVVSPLGLVAKATNWYLVAETKNGRRVFRVSRILGIRPLEYNFVRPTGFDLAAFWSDWVNAYETGLPQYPVILRVRTNQDLFFPDSEKFQTLWQAAEPEADGSRIIRYIFEKKEEAQAIIFGMGTSVEILEPKTLRETFAAMAQDLVKRYTR